MKDEARAPSWHYELMLLFTVAVWGANFAVVKAALAVMHPHVLNTFRFIVSAVVLALAYRYRMRGTGQSFFQPLRTHGLQIFALGILGFFLYQISFIIGLNRTTAGNGALIMASSPLWTAVAGSLFRLEKISRPAWAGLLVTFLGTIVVVVGGSKEVHFGSSTFTGNLLMLTAAIFWGAQTAFSKPVLRTVPATGLTFLSLLCALPFLFGIGIPYFDEVAWSRVDLWVWLAILYSGGLSTGLVIALWNTGIKAVGASHTAVYSNLTPLVALLVGYLLLGEAITFTQIAGGTLIIGGLVVMRRTRRPTARQGM